MYFSVLEAIKCWDRALGRIAGHGRWGEITCFCISDTTHAFGTIKLNSAQTQSYPKFQEFSEIVSLISYNFLTWISPKHGCQIVTRGTWLTTEKVIFSLHHPGFESQ